MDFSRPLSDDIFFDFIHSVYVDVDLKPLNEEIQRIKEECKETIIRSNEGGFHSNVYDIKHSAESEILNELMDGIRWYANEYMKNRYGYPRSLEISNWWFMVNNKGDYNVPHCHAKADIASVFYVKAPEECGDLVLKRTDGGVYCGWNQDRMKVTPESGRLYLFPAHLLHWVEPSKSDTERISIISNLKFV